MSLVDAKLAQIQAQFRSGEWQAVVDQATALQGREGERADLLGLKGVALHQLGLSEEGLASIDRALQLAPASPVLMINRCAMLLAVGQFAEAEETTRRILHSRPDHHGSRLNLALALEGLARHADAVAQLRKLLEAGAGLPVARRAMVRCLLALDEPEQALAFTDQAACAQDPALPELRARAWARAGRWREAADYWTERSVADPGNADVLVTLAHCLGQSGRSGAAIEPLHQALAINPDHVDARNLLANALLARGDVDAALQLHQRNWEQAPTRADLHSNRLIAMQHDPKLTPELLHDAHRQWSARHVPEIAPPRPRPRTMR